LLADCHEMDDKISLNVIFMSNCHLK